jgi:iron complex outermembrane receptor protein
MATRSHPIRSVALAALLALQGAALAQTTTITVTGRADTGATVAGFGGPLSMQPLQAAVLGADTLRDAGIVSLAGITGLDARLSDAYNSIGYWSGLTVRGFEVNQRTNFRRDGLPISGETWLPLADKERVEVLAGTSGIQAGTSAPGGLVNLVVKRPTGTVRDLNLGWTERGTLDAALDLSQRFGSGGQFGARLNVQATRLQPKQNSADGHASLFALALDWLPTPDSKLEFELESSRHAQPSVPAFSLLGGRVPDAKAIDPRTNINNQPWSQPVVLNGDTASLRWTQKLGADAQLSVHGATQRLHSDDRVAFPFGCSAEDDYSRYCSDGSFDLYDFRSENERRRLDALDVQLQTRASTGRLHHRLTAGVLISRVHDRFQRQAYNYVGSGSAAADGVVAPDPALTDENTQRDEHSRELYLRDAVQLGERWQLWAGLRHSRLHRESVRTDGSRAIDVTQSFTTPWLALGFTPTNGTLVYASWGRGIESDVTPNRSKYLNAGDGRTLASRQAELGVKLAVGAAEHSATLFDIRRDAVHDFCDDRGSSCERRIDGAARHRGLELASSVREGAWTLRGSASWLQARREDSAVADLNGKRPTNVPGRSLKAQVQRELQPGLRAEVAVVHEGRRAVLPDNSVELGGWTRLDASLSWRLPGVGNSTRLRLGVDNLTDRRAWRESPFQFEHAYLMPLAPRTWRAMLTTSF